MCRALLRTLTTFLIAVAIAGCEFSLSRPPLFEDDFEDGDLSIPPPGWGDPGGIYDRKTCFGNSFRGEYSLELWGPLEGYDQQARNGLYHFLVGDEADGGIRPNAISYSVIPDSSTYSDDPSILEARVAYFDLMGHVPGDPLLRAGISLHFLNRHQTDDTMVVLRSGSGLTEYGPTFQMALYHIEIKNIDWDASPTPKFDLYINGDLVGSCLTFIQPVASFTQLDVYNIHRGRCWYDNILMVVDRVIPCLDEPPPPPEPPALPPVSVTPSPTPTVTPSPRATATETPTPTPADLIVTALQNVNCRAGTTTQFDVLHILMAGETARVLAMNQARTWSYLEIPGADLHCWAWRGALEDTQGDPNRAPVTAEPPTPTPSPTATKIACAAELPEDLCLESGGTWDSEAVGAPECICP
jgi:hypothetical protein